MKYDKSPDVLQDMLLVSLFSVTTQGLTLSLPKGGGVRAGKISRRSRDIPRFHFLFVSLFRRWLTGRNRAYCRDAIYGVPTICRDSSLLTL